MKDSPSPPFGKERGFKMDTYHIIKSAIQHSPEVKWAHVQDGLAVSKLMVCKSAAGYYPGRLYFDADMYFVGPYSRAKMHGYFHDKAAAQQAIDEQVY